MTTALIYLGVSLFLLVTLVVLFRFEDVYGDRILFGKARAAGDRVLRAGSVRSGAVAHNGSINYVRLSWYYLVHTLLKRTLAGVRKLQSRLEDTIKKNRAAAKELQGGGVDPHLSAIAAHKEKVALSEEEREKRMTH